MERTPENRKKPGGCEPPGFLLCIIGLGNSPLPFGSDEFAKLFMTSTRVHFAGFVWMKSMNN
jgi:hypothetical protein